MYNTALTVRETLEFAKWLSRLKDLDAKARILMRIKRLALGNPGDSQVLEGGLQELRIACGPGYRVYYARIGELLVLLLLAGDKSSQHKDIEKARKLLARERSDV